MKVFCSYAFTGEDETLLRERMTGLRNLFQELSIDYYINLFLPEWQAMMARSATGGEFVRAAIKEMELCDTVLVIVSSDRRSEGMLMEVGAAVAMGKNIVLAQHTSAQGKSYLQTVAACTYTWETDRELLQNTAEYFAKHIDLSHILDQ